MSRSKPRILVAENDESSLKILLDLLESQGYEAAGTRFPKAEASVAVNSLGLLDLVQIAAMGLAPAARYQVALAESDRPPFGKREPLAVLRTNPDGAGIVQAVGPLKTLSGSGPAAPREAPRRFLIVADAEDPAQVVLQPAPAPTP